MLADAIGAEFRQFLEREHEGKPARVARPPTSTSIGNSMGRATARGMAERTAAFYTGG